MSETSSIRTATMRALGELIVLDLRRVSRRRHPRSRIEVIGENSSPPGTAAESVAEISDRAALAGVVQGGEEAALLKRCLCGTSALSSADRRQLAPFCDGPARTLMVRPLYSHATPHDAAGRQTERGFPSARQEPGDAGSSETPREEHW